MTLESVLKAIDANEAKALSTLAEVVAIQSVSATPALRPQVFRMAEWIRGRIETSFPGSEVTLYPIPYKESHSSGVELELPPIVLASVGPSHPEKKTLLIYAHYDVQPASKSDGWDTEPFEMTRNSKDELLGRGTTDDKGPLVGWILMLEAYRQAGKEFPVNIKFILEGMEESSSVGFDDTAALIKAKTTFFNDIDYACISDNYWLSTSKPCLTYGLRGMLACEMGVSGPSVDLHSGSFGGQVYQPMDDLLWLLSQLKDNDEKILIPHICDEVMPITAEERALYTDIHFSTQEKKQEIGVSRIRHEDNKTECLMSVWRNPALTIHGIQGAFSEPGFKTVIPRRVIGKWSIRLVPNMSLDKVEKDARTYLEDLWAMRKSPNKMDLKFLTGRWYYVDPHSPVFEAAKKATLKIHNVMPDLTREGGSIPITLTIKEMTGKDVVLLPMGRCNDGAHAQNEKLDLSNYMLGMKTYAAFLEELASLN